MSVQGGIWNYDGEPVDRDFLAKLSQLTAEYGPDGESIHIEGDAGLLYRPFYTTTESRLEKQPLICENKAVLTWDGRLDNRDELLTELAGSLTTSSTDVAIVASAFQKWGTECFRRLTGDWALAIWNSQERELILARDYIGVRQLFFYPRSSGIAWCTQLGPLVLTGTRFSICEEYIAGYLAFNPDAHLTPYRELRSVSPGAYVRIKRGKISTHTYWRFDPWRKTRYNTDAEYEEHYRHLFRQSVRRRLRADTPILASLSGGLDSTSIVCMADSILSDEASLSPRVDTFSYYDSLEPGEDDFYHLKKAEQQRNRTGFHLNAPGSGDSLSFEYAAFAATPGFGTRTEIKAGLSDLIARGEHRIMLSGIGGDEINAQALNPLIPIADSVVHLRLFDAAKQLFAWSLVTRRPFVKWLFEAVLELAPMSIRAHLTERAKLQPWMNRPFARKYRISARQIEDIEGIWFWRPGPRDAVQTITTLSRDLTYVAPSRLEQRYPYLDQTFVEFLTTVPFNQLLRPGQRRFLMRRGLANLLPAEIATRKTKVSAIRCYPLAVQKHWNKIIQVFHSALSAKLGFVESKELLAELTMLKDGHVPDHISRLLKALSLELWLQDLSARGIVPLVAANRLIEERVTERRSVAV